MPFSTCFVVCPISKKGSEIRARSDDLMSEVLEPVLVDEHGMRVDRADRVYRARLTESVVGGVLGADLVVADLTGLNPNVLYELGMRHPWGPTILMTRDSVDTLPADLREYEVISYALNGPAGITKAQSDLRRALRTLTRRTPFPELPDIRRFPDIFGITVLLERRGTERDQYDMAQEIFARRVRRIFLMQRSSTLILGPEDDLDQELVFRDRLLKAVSDGADLLNLVSIDGIKQHLARGRDHFSHTEAQLALLDRNTVRVGLEGPTGVSWFRRAPSGHEEVALAQDRQARTLLVELADGTYEGVVVINLGSRQTSFYLRGPEMGTFFDTCRSYFKRCDYLLWEELQALGIA